MKISIVISSNDPETVWNVLRFANFSLKEGNGVKIFLLGKGVEVEQISNDTFDTLNQLITFTDGGGEIMACTGCLKLRNSEGTELCPLSTMRDMYEMIKESDKLLTF